MLDWEQIQASGHDQHAQYQTAHGQARLEHTKQLLAGLIPEGAPGRYLDLGCGMGLHTAWIAERISGRVLGIDVAAYGLQRATPHPRATYLQADANDLGNIGRFDVALAAQIFEYLDDPWQVTRSLRVKTWVITLPATITPEEEALCHPHPFDETSARSLLGHLDHFERDGPYFYLVGQ